MKTYQVMNLYTGETWNIPAPCAEDAAYIVVLDRLGRNYEEFFEQYGRWTFNLVLRSNELVVYSVVR